MLAMPMAAAVAVGVALALGASVSSVVGAQGSATVPRSAGTGISRASQWLVGTWQLTRLERADGGQLSPVANPVGILIQDKRGHVIQIVTTAGRPASLDAATQFTTYQAFWGTYSADPNGSTATYLIQGDLDPGRKDRRIIRSVERQESRLVLTEAADGRPLMRTTWQPIPDFEALPDYQRDVVGFWKWTSAGLYNASGANVREASRDPSVIVYTPTGHMAVLYLPPPGRKPFAGAVPTNDEARAAMQGSVSYFGTYIVQPKSRAVYHYQLAAMNPAAVGGSFMRNFEIKGAQVTLLFPPTMLNGQQVRNTLTLERLSGLTDFEVEK
jgi:lipocalin-like protein